MNYIETVLLIQNRKDAKYYVLTSEFYQIVPANTELEVLK